MITYYHTSFTCTIDTYDRAASRANPEEWYVMVSFHSLLKVHRQKLVSYIIMDFHPLLKVHRLKFVRSFLWLSFRCPGTRTTGRVTAEPAEQPARPGAEIGGLVPVTSLQKAAFKLFFDDNQAQKKSTRRARTRQGGDGAEVRSAILPWRVQACG